MPHERTRNKKPDGTKNRGPLECCLPALKRGEKAPKRVMIVDDGPEVRQVIRAAFEARTDFEICGEASNRAEAIEKP